MHFLRIYFALFSDEIGGLPAADRCRSQMVKLESNAQYAPLVADA